MSSYVCDCTNVVYMFCVYCIYYYVNKFEARSLFSTSHLKTPLASYFTMEIKSLGEKILCHLVYLQVRREITKLNSLYLHLCNMP